MRTKVLSTNHTVYPFDYDKNNMSGVDEWRKYIHNELDKSITPADSIIVEANKILTQDSRYKTPLTEKQKVNGDRVVYVVMLLVTIALSLIFSTQK